MNTNYYLVKVLDNDDNWMVLKALDTEEEAAALVAELNAKAGSPEVALYERHERQFAAQPSA